MGLDVLLNCDLKGRGVKQTEILDNMSSHSDSLLPKNENESISRKSEVDEYNSCLAGPILILRACLLPIKKTDMKLPAMVTLFLMWIYMLSVNIYWVKQLMIGYDQSIAYLFLSNFLWMAHALIIFTIVSKSMLKNSHLLDIMIYTVEKDNNERRLQIADRNVASLRKKLTISSFLATAVVVFGVIVNISAVVVTFNAGYVYSLFPISKSPWYYAFVFLTWYFYSFGYFLTLLFSCVPSYILTERIMELVDYVESLNSKISNGEMDFDFSQVHRPSIRSVIHIDFDEINDWYDDLYSINSKLNGLVSGMVTTTIAVCAPLTVVIILVYLNTPEVMAVIDSMFTISWSVLNVILIVSVSYVVARLESMNRRFHMAMGSIQSMTKNTDRDILLFQTILMKVKANPFGIAVYGTRYYISFEAIFQVASIVVSAFIFLIGVQQV